MKRLALLVAVVSLLGLASCDLAQTDIDNAFNAVTAGLESCSTPDGSLTKNADGSYSMKMKSADNTVTAVFTLKSDDGVEFKSGSKIEYKFANYKHSASGYTLNGTVNAGFTGNFEKSYAMVFTGSLTPTGGAVNAIQLNFTATSTVSGTKTTTAYSGGMTLNGKEYKFK